MLWVASHAGDTDAQRQIRKAEELSEETRIQEDTQPAEEHEFDSEMQAKSQRNPLTKDEWTVHIASGIFPETNYVYIRFIEGGDRFELSELFTCCTII